MTASIMHNNSIVTHSRHLASVVLLSLALQSCASVELASVADTQYIMSTRDLPLTSMLVVCDTRDLGFKSAMETEFVQYLKENAGLTVFRDIDLYSPLKTMTEKEKLWALKDAGIQAVLFLNGGGSGRPLRDWLYPDAADVDTKTQAWTSTTVRLFLPQTGIVIWAAGIAGQEQLITPELQNRSFYSAVAGDLLRRGFIALRTENEPMIRGFNR